MKLHSLEGNIQKLDGGAMYGNAPREVWQKWTPPDEKNRIALACRSLLLQTDDGRNILFETGVGAFFEDKLKERFGVSPKEHVLLQSLQQIGLSDSDIDVVILSHLHFDHAGGLLSAYGDGEPRLLFPKATYMVGAKQWDRSNAAHQRDRASYIPVLNGLLEKSGRLILVGAAGAPLQTPSGRQPPTAPFIAGGAPALAPLVTFSFSDGHTPGLMLSHIHLPSGPLVFVADLIPGIPWTHIPITMGYDRFPELLIDEKEALLKDLVKNAGKVFFTHDMQTPCGQVTRDDKGKFSATPISLENLGSV